MQKKEQPTIHLSGIPRDAMKTTFNGSRPKQLKHNYTIPANIICINKNQSHYKLTEPEKRDIIRLIEQGKPLPDKYRFFLFEDKREVELIWNGKTRKVRTAVLPFQTIEHIDEPRKEGGTGIPACDPANADMSFRATLQPELLHA